jgi:ankyrin repeat protein
MLAVNKEGGEVTRLLLLAGADIKLKDNDGATVFDYALPRRNESINQLLIISRDGKDIPEEVPVDETKEKYKPVEYDH